MMNGYYTIEVRDREGKLLKRLRRKSRSYVKQWNQLVYVQCGQIASYSMKDIGGDLHNVGPTGASFQANGGIGVYYYGIVFGTGSTAVTISDYDLATRIAHGTGSTQLSYQANALSAPAVVGSACSFTITRTAINNSGATITVREIGLVIIAMAGGSSYYFLAVRDVLPTPLAVPADGAITVVYTMKATV